jgi:hypothetical protein
MAIRGRKPGSPKTGGRKRGVVNKRTVALVEAVQRGGIMPLDYMLDVLREPPVTQMDEEDDTTYIRRLMAQEESRRWASNAAAPYCHARLAAVEVKQNADQFAAEQAAKAAQMDITEVARRIAFIFASATREKSNAQRNQGSQGRVAPEERVRH